MHEVVRLHGFNWFFIFVSLVGHVLGIQLASDVAASFESC